MARFLFGISFYIAIGFPQGVVSAQQPDSGWVVSVQAEAESLRRVMDRIEEQTGLSFSYPSRLIDGNSTVSVSFSEVPLKEALAILFRDRRVGYEIVEQQIVLRKNRRIRMEADASLTMIEGGEVPVQFTLSGYVRDALSGEVLIGATVAIPGSVEGTITNNYGFYSLTIKRAVKELFCSYVGYRLMVIPVNGSGDQVLHFTMEKEISQLREVTVYSEEQENVIRTARSSEERLRPESVRKMPALFGEKDVIKSLAAIPGIKFFGDGSTIFYVRGGGRDQNLITIDEAPVYNPTHLLGFFSTVVPDAVKEVKIYKGDFPASQGGRLSSLIDIRTKDGNMNRFGADGSVGLLSSRLSLEGPLWKEHISFFLSGRRSYLNRTLQKFNDRIVDLHFSDLHFKLNYRINSRNRFFFSMYNGIDNFEQQPNSDFSSGINWQNSTTTLRWNHLFSDRLFSNLTLFGSRYDYFLNTNIQQKDFWKSHVDNVTLKYDFTWYVSTNNNFRFGFLSAGHFQDPGNYYRAGEEFDPGLDLSTKRNREFALYASEQYLLGNKFSLRAGARLTAWQNIGPATEYAIIPSVGGDFVRDSLQVTEYPAGSVYHSSLSLDPRFSLVYQPTRKDVLTFSYNRTSQFQYLITNSISPFTSLEVWLPASPNVKPQASHQITLGYSRRLGQSGTSLEVETYYKHMINLIDYRDHARMLMNPLVEYELRFGKGRAYGLEVIFHKDAGKLNGWVAYTLSKAWSQVEGISGGEPYPAYSDRPHDISLYLSWQVGSRVTLTGNFIYMTGAPYTTPTGFYYYDNHQVPIYALRNNDRLPDYHRLDVAMNWQLNKPGQRFRHELILSVYNLYNRKNPVALHFNKIGEGNGTFVVPYDFYENPELTPTVFYLYGLVPSISYHFTF